MGSRELYEIQQDQMQGVATCSRPAVCTDWAKNSLRAALHRGSKGKFGWALGNLIQFLIWWDAKLPTAGELDLSEP